VIIVNPLNVKLNPICHLLALLGAHHIPYVSRMRVKLDRTCTYIVILWRVRVTVIAIGKQQWVQCVFSNYVCRCQQYELGVLKEKGNNVLYFELLLSR